MSETCRGHLWDKIIIKLFASSWYIFLTYLHDARSHLYQIHELILEDCRISFKSIAEQLDISRERVGFIIHEDLDMRKPSAKWVPKFLNADQKRQRCQSSEQYLEFIRRDSNDLLSRLVTMDETWLCITMTRRQRNNQWSDGIVSHSAPKNSECKNSLENFSPRFFGIKTVSIHYLRKGQTINAEYYSSLLVQLKYILKGKRRGNFTKGVFTYTTMPRLTVRLQPRRKWLTWASSVLVSHPILRIWPRRTTACSVDWKKWKFAIFLPTRRSLLSRRPGWTDNILIFFEWLAKVRTTG